MLKKGEGEMSIFILLKIKEYITKKKKKKNLRQKF